MNNGAIMGPGDALLRTALSQTAGAREFQRFDRGAAGAGGVAVGHDVNRNRRLLDALGGHALADLVEEPLLEFLAGFDRAAADNQRVGVEGVDHLVEEETE